MKYKKVASPRGTGQKKGYPKGGTPLALGYSIPSTYPKINMASIHQVGTSVPVPTKGFAGGSPEVITTKMPGGKSRGGMKGGI